MRVDFYQLTRHPAEALVPLLAQATLNAGERLLVLSADQAQLGRVSDALWSSKPESFLAHGRNGEGSEDRQPILLSQVPQPGNGARYMLLADGLWREEALNFERTFLLFGEETLQAARDCWKELGRHEGLERHFWKREDGKWLEKR